MSKTNQSVRQPAILVVKIKEPITHGISQITYYEATYWLVDSIEGDVLAQFDLAVLNKEEAFDELKLSYLSMLSEMLSTNYFIDAIQSAEEYGPVRIPCGTVD